MVIDSHFHFDERMMTVDSLINKMNEAGIDKVALMAQLTDPIPEPGNMLISFGQFILNNKYSRKAAKFIVSNFTEAGDIKLPSGVYHIYPEPDNSLVFKAVEKNPGKFFGWVFVNPAGKNNPEAECKKWKKSPGFIGVKSHPFWHRYPVKDLLPVAGLAARDGKPLLMHAGFDAEGDFMALRRELPELKIILAHAGFPQLSDTWKMIRSDKKIFVDFSSNHYVGKKTIRDAVEYLGPERCLFGTDGPFGQRSTDGTMDYGLIKRRIESLFADKGVVKRILGENFMEIAGIK